MLLVWRGPAHNKHAKAGSLLPGPVPVTPIFALLRAPVKSVDTFAYRARARPNRPRAPLTGQVCESV